MYPWTYRQESESRNVAWIADEAEAFFSSTKAEDKPFFLTIGYVDPHRDVATRGGFGNTDYDSRVSRARYDPSQVEVPSWLPDLPETRQELAEYYEAINRTDQGVGLVLDALERQGLRDDTLVIITSDNGPPFMNAKTTLYDAGTCLPFIVVPPRSSSVHAKAKGITNPNMLSYVDILPTLLDYAGIADKPNSGEYIKPGAGMLDDRPLPSPPRGGRSFLPILARSDVAPESEWQHHVFGSHTFHELQNYWPTRVCRSRRFKYHRNIAWKLDFPFAADLYASYTFEGMRKMAEPMMGSRRFQDYLSRPAEELFDLENDPDELRNLVDDPKYADILTEHRTKTERWQKRTHDLWLFKDGHSVEKMHRYGVDGLKATSGFDMAIRADDTNLVAVDKLVL